MSEHERTGLDRREFLSASVATAGAVLLGPGCGAEGPPRRREAPPEPEPADGAEIVAFDPESVPEDPERFPVGLASGDMTPTSALLWTQTTGPGRVRVWRPGRGPGQVKLAADLPVTPADGGYAKVRVRGLGPGRYTYAFFDEALTRRSPIGQLRTAFAPDDLRPLTLGTMSCTNWSREPFEALERLAAEAPDVLVHLGDLSYNDGSRTRDEFRRLYRRTLATSGYRAALSSAGLYATWDDHEVDNNFDPERLARENPELLATATEAYFETLPLPEEERRLWRSHRWGRTAEVFMLDCRSERRPSTLGTEAAQYIGQSQLEWLLGALETSPCHFKVIASSVPFTRLFGLWDLARNDRWQGYASQRQRVLDHLTSRVSGRVIFVAGDFHCGFVSRVEPEGPGRSIFEVTTSTGPSGPNPIAVLHDTGELPPEESFPPDQFLFGTGSTRLACTLHLDPLNDEARVRFVDAREMRRGEVLFDELLPFQRTN
jgi:alkaline phosphatase D